MPDRKDPKVTPKRKWLIASLRLMGSAVVLTLLFLLLPRESLWAAIKRLTPGVWLMTLVAYLLLHLLGITKWRMMVNLAGGGLSYVGAVRCYYAGLFGSIYLPSIVGGDVVRAGLGLRIVRSKIGLLLGSLVDRIQDLLALLIVAAIGAFLLPRQLDAQSRRIFWLVAAAFVAGLLGLMALLAVLPARRFSFRMRRRIVRVRQGIRAGSRRPQIMLLSLLLGISLQIGLTLLNAFLADACGLHIAWTVWLFAWPLSKMAAMMPISQGGIGVREATLVALLAPFGATSALAFAAGLVFQTILISGGLVSGLIAMALGRGSLLAAGNDGQVPRDQKTIA
ncbi:MAG: flippase-like domain-containing protein [Acidobacteriia bacterium]|nr:flippase-like domain-containing protein [Terriglobia bacterium]